MRLCHPPDPLGHFKYHPRNPPKGGGGRGAQKHGGNEERGQGGQGDVENPRGWGLGNVDESEDSGDREDRGTWRKVRTGR